MNMFIIINMNIKPVDKLAEKDGYVNVKGQKTAETSVTMGPKGSGLGFTVPEKYLEAMAGYYHCERSELASRVKWKITLIFPTDGKAPFFALSLPGGEKDE